MSTTELDLSLPARYHTTWPVLTTRIGWAAARRTVAACTFGRSRWLRITTATLLGGIPALLIAATWAAVLWSLIVLWPLGWLMMLPTRIAVRRGTPQVHMIYALCWVSLPLFTFPCWWVALVLAYRDPASTS